MKNLQKDSPGSQWEQQFSCQALVASRCALIWRVSKALSRVCHANPLAQRNDDNFVAPNMSQSASLFYKRAIGVSNRGQTPIFATCGAHCARPMATAPSSPAAGRAPARTRACCA